MSPKTTSPAQESDVTICRCGHNVEEGKMVVCEECNTWQHVICYYPNELIPAVHFCEGCGAKYQDKKRAAKRQRVDHTTASWNSDTPGATKPQFWGRSVGETVYTWREVSLELGSRALSEIVTTTGEQETSSDDEPLISRASKRPARSVSKIKIEAGPTPLAGRRQQAISVGKAIYSTVPFIDLTDKTKDAIRVKIEPHDDHSLENARETLLSRFMTPGASPTAHVSVAPTATLKTPFTPTVTPVKTPQPIRTARPSFGAGGTSQLINKATTLVFLDSQNKEVRRRTFEDLGGRLNVGTLFGQAIRAGLIEKSDEDAILSVSIRGVGETFNILRDDKPDFKRLMQKVEVAGLCIVEVRLD